VYAQQTVTVPFTTEYEQSSTQSEYSTAAIALITDNQHSKQTEKHSENYTCININ